MGKLLALFGEFFRISLFVIGGGYAIIAVADETCARRKWTHEGELLTNLPVFQLIPGLIATHCALYVGRKVAGRLGAAIAVLAIALPAVTIFTFVAMGYGAIPIENALLKSFFVGLRAALTGIIAATLVRSWKNNLQDSFAYSVMIFSVLAIALFHMNIAIVILLAAAAGMLTQMMPRLGGTQRFNTVFWPFLLFLKYGSLCFGGGFVIIPMYIEDFVGATAPYLNLSMEEFSNVMALSQMTPGPIGINAVTFFGYRLLSGYGVFWGAIGAVAASVLLLIPGSCLLYLTLRSIDCYRENRWVRGIFQGIRPASVALMLVAFWAFLGMSAFTLHESGEISYNVWSILLTVVSMLIIMKKKLNVIALIWLCAFAALVVRADDDITPEHYPDADTVVINEIEKVRYFDDGTSACSEESWVKLLTEKGRREESVIRLDYSKRYGEAKIVYVGAIDELGNEREIDISKTVNEATDNSSMGSNIYDPLDRIITCTVPGLKIGETLHLKTMRKTLKPRCEGKWADISMLEWTHPILRSVYEIISPTNLPLRKIAIRNPLGNVATNLTDNADGTITYLFTATNSPQVFPEPDMPPLYTQVQNVRVSTSFDWPEISSWYAGLCAPHLAKTNAAMVSKIEEIAPAARNLTRQDRIRAIFKFVSQEIRYMGLTMEDASPGFSPHDVDITFNNRYGVCRDKAALLVAMLRLAGIDAFPVLIHAGAKLDPEVPQPFFNHAIVAVENPEADWPRLCRYQLMDPTNENAKDLFPAYLSDKSYLVCRAEGEKLMTSPVPSPDDNRLDISTSATLNRDGSMVAFSKIVMNGINDVAYRHLLAKQTRQERVRFLERMVKAISPGSELIKSEILPEDMRDTEAPIVIDFAARYPEMLLQGETRDELTLPIVSGTIGIANYLLMGDTALEERRYPLALDTTAKVTEKIELKFDGYEGKVVDLPPAEHLEGDYDYAFSCVECTNGLRIARSLTIGAMEFSPAAYGELRESIKRVEAAARQRPILTRNSLADADVHYLDSVTETSFLSERSWVTTNTIVKEVLTYAGKKAAAELKYEYNPTWKTIALNYATVSNRNGQVSVVGEKEINLMDQGWVSSAPRYPAGKILVVNLPSVEIGSVITYQVVVTVTNAPAAYYSTFNFDCREPTDHKLVRIGDWSREVVNLKRLPREPGQPTDGLWRDCQIVSQGRFEPLDLEVGECALPFEGEASLRDIRDWMAKYVKVSGPSVYDVPLAQQLTPPAVVLKERYATRLDYIRTLTALLKGAGYDAAVVLASRNAHDTEAEKRRDKYEKPNVRAFANPLCRVRVREGGLFGLGTKDRTYFIGTENEHAELGASDFADCDYFDPQTGDFGVVSLSDISFEDASVERSVYTIRGNGTVDVEVENLFYGSAVAAFRKRFAEMVPELKFRHYQQLLGSIAQAASATSDYETDVESYPARSHFACYIPDFAVVKDDAVTITLPPIVSSIPQFPGKSRVSPFAVSAADREIEEITIRFPPGYTQIEHLPVDFEFVNPLNPGERWLKSETTTAVKDGVLEIKLRREVFRRGYSIFAAPYVELLNDWQRIATSKSNRTLVVRQR